MSGRGVPDFPLAQNIERIPVYMSRLQITMEGRPEVNERRLRTASNLRSSYLAQQHSQRSSRAIPTSTLPGAADLGSRVKSVNSSAKKTSLSSKPLKSSLKNPSRSNMTAKKEKEAGVDKEVAVKAFGSPNSSLESISEKSEPEELSEIVHSTQNPQIVSVNNRHTDSPLPVYSQADIKVKTSNTSTLFFRNDCLASDDDDNIPLAALTKKKGFAGQSTEKVNLQVEKSKQFKVNKTSERVRSVSFSAHTEFIPNDIDFYSDDDTSSIHSRRRTCSLDDLSEISGEGPFNPYYNAAHPQHFNMLDNQSMMMLKHVTRDKKTKSRYRNSKYPENDTATYYDNNRPFPTYFTTTSSERLVDMTPQPSHRYTPDIHYQSRINTPLIKSTHQKSDRYSGIFQESSENHFSNSHIIHRSLSTSAHPSLSRASSVRSTSSTVSLPSTMCSFATHRNSLDSGLTSHRNSIRSFHEISPRSPSITRISNSQRMLNTTLYTEIGRVPTNPRGKNIR